jgi:hypothetical protein
MKMSIANKEDFEAMWKMRYGNDKVRYTEARKFLDDFNVALETNLKIVPNLESDIGYDVFKLGE